LRVGKGERVKGEGRKKGEGLRVGKGEVLRVGKGDNG
jgi:hypothetical protein